MLAYCVQKVYKLSETKFVMFCKQFANIYWDFLGKILRTIFSIEVEEFVSQAKDHKG